MCFYFFLFIKTKKNVIILECRKVTDDIMDDWLHPTWRFAATRSLWPLALRFTHPEMCDLDRFAFFFFLFSLKIYIYIYIYLLTYVLSRSSICGSKLSRNIHSQKKKKRNIHFNWLLQQVPFFSMKMKHRPLLIFL